MRESAFCSHSVSGLVRLGTAARHPAVSLFLAGVLCLAAAGLDLCAQQLFVINQTDKNVVFFDVSRDAFMRPDTGFLGVFGETAGNLVSPKDLLFQPSTGHLFVVDGVGQADSVVAAFDASGTFLGEFGETRANLSFPSSLAVDPTTGNLIVTERNIFVTFQGAVKEFDGPTGAFLGSFGQAEGNVNQPLAAAFQPTSGDLFVLDCPPVSGKINCDVRGFSGASGAFLGIFGQTAEKLTNALDMDFDAAGRLLVLHQADGAVQPSILIFDGARGDLVDSFELSPLSPSPVAFSVYEVAAPSSAPATGTGLQTAARMGGTVSAQTGTERRVGLSTADGAIDVYVVQGARIIGKLGDPSSTQGKSLGRTAVRDDPVVACLKVLQDLIGRNAALSPSEKGGLNFMITGLIGVHAMQIDQGMEPFISLGVLERALSEATAGKPQESLQEIWVKFGSLGRLKGVLGPSGEASPSEPVQPPGSTAPSVEAAAGGCSVQILTSRYFPLEKRAMLLNLDSVTARGPLFEESLEAQAFDDLGVLLKGSFDWSVAYGSGARVWEGESVTNGSPQNVSRAYVNMSEPKKLSLLSAGSGFASNVGILVKFTEAASPNRMCEDQFEVQIRIPVRPRGPVPDAQQAAGRASWSVATSGTLVQALPAAELKQRLDTLRSDVNSVAPALPAGQKSLLNLLLDLVENRIDDGSSAPVISAQLAVFRLGLTANTAVLSDMRLLEMLGKVSAIEDLLLAEGFAAGLGAAPPALPPSGQCVVKIYEARHNPFVRAFSAIETPFEGTVPLDNEGVRRDLAAEARDAAGARLDGDYQWSLEPAVPGTGLQTVSASRQDLVSTGLTLEKEAEARRAGTLFEANYRVRVRFVAAGGGFSCEDTADVQLRFFP